MRRSVDLVCESCEAERHDVICAEDEVVNCHVCNMPMQQIWWQRSTTKRSAQWDDATAIVVHVARDPSIPDDVAIRYPMRTDAPVPRGYEAVRLRNLQEANRFEREHKVMNERLHFDSNGRSINDYYKGERMTH